MSGTATGQPRFHTRRQVSHSEKVPGLCIQTSSGKEAVVCIGVIATWGFPKIMGTIFHFGSSHNKDYNALGSILVSSYFRKLPLESSNRPVYGPMYVKPLSVLEVQFSRFRWCGKALRRLPNLRDIV